MHNGEMERVRIGRKALRGCDDIHVAREPGRLTITATVRARNDRDAVANKELAWSAMGAQPNPTFTIRKGPLEMRGRGIVTSAGPFTATATGKDATIVIVSDGRWESTWDDGGQA